MFELFWGSFGVGWVAFVGRGSVTVAGLRVLEERSVAPEAAVAAIGSIAGAPIAAETARRSVLWL